MRRNVYRWIVVVTWFVCACIAGAPAWVAMMFAAVMGYLVFPERAA
ncbi:MAG TPA: hypothetical protein VF216_03060 [Mizugakiibacter sp.]